MNGIRRKTAAVAAAGIIAVALSGCAMLNRTNFTCTRTTTVGRELVDLKEAKDKGVITDKEYDAQKAKIRP